MEITRIFKNKRMLFFTAVLLCLNVVFFVKDQYSGHYRLADQRQLRRECVKRYRGWDLKKAAQDLQARKDRAAELSELADYEQLKKDAGEFLEEETKKQIAEYEQEHAGLYREYRENRKKYPQERLQVEMIVYGELHERYCHILEFREKLEKIRQNEETMSQVSIFRNSRTTGRSIDKTTADYRRLDGTVTELGNDDFLTSVYSYGKSMYFVFLFVLVMVWQMLAERKKGLWVVVHAAKKGRAGLAVRRVGVLAAGVAGFLLAEQGMLFAASGILYGPETDFGRSIQSIPLFSGLTVPMTEAQFIVADYLVMWLAASFLALFVWMVFVAVDSRVPAMMAVLAVYLTGFLLYSGLADQSHLVVLKYVNFYYFLHARRMFSSYLNLRLAGHVCNRIPVVCVLLAAGTAGCAAAGILIQAHKYPCRRQGLLERLLARLAEKLRGVTAHFSLMGMELYKLLVVQKGLFVLLVLLYLCVSSLDRYPLYYSAQEQFLNRFYREYAGPLDREALEYLEESEREAEQKTEEYRAAQAAYKKGELGETEWEVARMKYEAASGVILGSAALRSRITSLLAVQKALDRRLWVVNPSGYERLFGEKSPDRQTQENLKILVSTVLLLAGLLAPERRRGTKEILCATLRGREDLLEKKAAAGAVCASAAFVCVKAASFVSLAQLFPFSCWTAPLKSLPGMAYNVWNGTIAGYCAWVAVLQLAAVVAFGMLVGALSAILPAEMTVIAGMVPLVPSFLDVFGVGVPAFLSPARLSAVVTWQGTASGPGSYVLYWLVVAAVAAAAWKVMNVFWAGKGKKA